MTSEASEFVLDLSGAFVKSAEFEMAEVDGPEAIIDFFEGNVFAGEDLTDVDPAASPADAAVGADATDFEVIGVFQRWQPIGIRSW